MPGRTAEPIQIYQLRVTLVGSHPPIWRQFQVRCDITLAKLHQILQAVMGWTDSHLHQFLIRGKQYGMPDESDIGLCKNLDEREYKLRDVVSGQALRFTYTYDFGDGWEHGLLIESVLPPEEAVRYPVCSQVPAPVLRKM